MADQLRLRIREDLEAGQCHVEVLDKSGKVLGDLAGSVLFGGVKWEMSGGLGPDKSKMIHKLAPLIEEMAARYPEHVIAERLVDVYEAERSASGPNRGLGIVTLQLACERAQIDTIEVKGVNVL